MLHTQNCFVCLSLCYVTVVTESGDFKYLDVTTDSDPAFNIHSDGNTFLSQKNCQH